MVIRSGGPPGGWASGDLPVWAGRPGREQTTRGVSETLRSDPRLGS